MSAVIRTKRFKKLSVSTPALWVLLGLAVTFFLVRYGQEVLMQHDLDQKIVLQQQTNKAVADENARLAALLEYYQSDRYVEQRAREDLNLRRGDEEVLIPVGGAASSAVPGALAFTGAPSTPEATPATTPANWQAWLGLFSPFASGSP